MSIEPLAHAPTTQLNAELMRMTLEAGAEVMANRLEWICHFKGIDLTPEVIETAVASMWDEFAKEAALNYALVASGLVTEEWS